MTDAAATISRLHSALEAEAGDGAGMAACYAPVATFEDPAFGRLEGDQVGAMWRMLTSRSSGVRVDLREHEATGTTGSAHWVASYRFGPDGLITEHVDRFDLARWGAQAVGPVQGLLGRTPRLGLLVRGTTARQLAAHDGTRR